MTLFEPVRGWGCVLGHGDPRTGLIDVHYRAVIKDGHYPHLGYPTPDEFLHLVVNVMLDGVALVGEQTILVSLTAEREFGRFAMHWPRLVWHPKEHAYHSEAIAPDDEENPRLDHMFVYSLGAAR